MSGPAEPRVVDPDIEQDIAEKFRDKAYDLDELAQWAQSIRDRERAQTNALRDAVQRAARELAEAL